MVDPTETDLWSPGTSPPSWAGAGSAPRRTSPQNLRKVDVPIAEDSRCTTAYGAAFKPDVMMCAADPLGTSTATARDFCEGDEGGPLLVPDGSSSCALAGVVSWHGPRRAPTAAHPGVYTRLGDGALNRWVHTGRRRPTSTSATSRAPASR